MSNKFSCLSLGWSPVHELGCVRQGGPVIDWVTPPVWLQTQTENTPAWHGMTVTRHAMLATDKGGKVMVLLGLEQVELDENSLGEWAGKEDGSGGNTVQGRVRVGSAPVRSQAIKNRYAKSHGSQVD